jgi:hypothetical protein
MKSLRDGFGLNGTSFVTVSTAPGRTFPFPSCPKRDKRTKKVQETDDTPDPNMEKYYFVRPIPIRRLPFQQTR